MPIPLIAGAAMGAGAIGSSLIDMFGGDAAANALKEAQGKARTDLTAGYTAGKGYQQPIYDTGLKNYTDLSTGYGAGKFDNGHMDPYKFDPNSVFQDPEYQAQMRAGTGAISQNNNNGSMLFSGQNDRDLTKFGQDTFAGRSDALYKRGFDATNTAFNQNALTNSTNFNEGMNLANPGIQASGKLTDLSVNQGSDMANIDLGSGMIRANNINNTASALGKGLTDLSGLGADYAMKGGKFAAASGMK
jgi:hypothetical protein